MTLTKKEWILVVLNQYPLDRIRLMKALFLIWHRLGRKVSDYFEFVPYLYGPCSFEVYSVLEELLIDKNITQLPHTVQQWANYYLSPEGRREAEEISKKIDVNILKLLKEVTKEISHMGFFELLRKVYLEAPDFAVNSMFGGILKL